MDAERRRVWTYAAACGLVFLTLYVFYRLQDYGPESAIRRFNADVVNNDLVDLQSVTKQPINSSNALALRGRVARLLSAGCSYRLLTMERLPFQVRVAIVYTPPSGPQYPLIWVVEKNGRAWKVNTDKTMNIIRDALGI